MIANQNSRYGVGINLINANVLEWARDYKGEKFHALLCDAPYHLTSITKRFGKPGSAPAKHGKDGAFSRVSRGFMGQDWDGGDIAFRPETWVALGEHLYPGAFCMAFSSARTSHRMAVAIEDAGFIIHPSIYWCYSSGFPKATNISKQIDKQAGAERKVVGKYVPPNGKPWNLSQDEDPTIPHAKPTFTASGNRTLDITESRTDLGKTWEGHRYGMQALKPAAEPIIVFQKPYEGRPLDNITSTGAGALNIDASRIKTNPGVDDPRLGGNGKWRTDKAAKNVYEGGYSGEDIASSPLGRWPANILFQHSPDCKLVGYKNVEGYVINRFDDGAKPFGGGAGHDYTSDEQPDEQMEIWECSQDCAVAALNRQSGVTQSGFMKAGQERKDSDGGYHGNFPRIIANDTYGDAGGAGRFFFTFQEEALDESDPFYYCAKASQKEREAGLDDFESVPMGFSNGAQIHGEGYDKGQDIGLNRVKQRKCTHPTVKPIDLNKYLATLLLPPDLYAPRRILVPFAGVGSEMIGAFMAGWEEIVGIEWKPEYCEIGEARIKHWASKPRQTRMNI